MAQKRILPERFEQAIDRAAMKVGARMLMPIWLNGARLTPIPLRVKTLQLPMPKSHALTPNMIASASKR